MSKYQFARGMINSTLLRFLFVLAIINNTSPLAAQEFQFKIDTNLKGSPPVVPGANQEVLTVGVILNPKGKPEQFIESEVILKSDDPAFVKNFVGKWSGRIQSNGSLPEPDARMQKQARDIPKTVGFYLVRVDPSNVNINKIPAYAQKLGLKGNYTFSSENILRLFGLYLEEIVSGNDVITLNMVFMNDQCPTTSTQEWPWDPAAPNPASANEGYSDAYAWGCFSDSDIRLTEAWQLIDLLGTNTGTVNLCIIDQGFIMNEDFPAYSQYDFVDDDRDVDADEADYHGMGCISISSATRNNRFGSVGTGAQVTWPMAFRHNLTMWNTARAIRTATRWGADVVSMSFHYQCDWWCSLALGLTGNVLLNFAIDEAYANGVVLLAAAGNSERDLDSHFYLPVEGGSPGKSPIGVGAITLDTKEAVRSSRFGWGSCYGANVDIWAPGAGGREDLFLWTTPTPADPDIHAFGGTSCATPYTAGIVAMMMAVNPTLSREDIETILQETANTSPDARVVPGYVNAFAAVQEALLLPGGITSAPDDFEPNDFSDFFPIVPEEEYCANLSSDDPEDGYYFYVDDMRPVRVQQEQLLMGDYTTTISGPGINPPQPLPFEDDLLPGGYYLRFEPGADGSPCFYRLQAMIGDPTPITPDRFEVNNTLAAPAELIFPSTQINDVMAVEDINFHVRGDLDYFEVVLPDLPDDPANPYTDRLTIWVEPSEREFSSSFRLVVYDASGTPEPVTGRGTNIEHVRDAYSDGRLRFLVYDGLDRRNFYRMEIGYDQYVRGIAPLPETLSFFEIPSWIEAESDRQFLDPPPSFGQGLPFDLSFPSNPTIIESFAAGKPIYPIPTETMIVKWPYKQDFGVEFSFSGYSQEMNFSLIDKKGEVIAKAEDISSPTGMSNQQSKRMTKRIKVSNLEKGIYGINVDGSRFPTPYTLKFDPAKTTNVTQKTRTQAPSEFALFQNYPNPFNPTTTIAYDLPHAAFVELSVLDLMGRDIRRLLEQKQAAGHHSVLWDGRDERGAPATSGVYFYRIKVKMGRRTITDMDKMILMK